MAIGRLDGYTENQTDQADLEQQWPQLKGQFLIDRDGIVRWANIECAEGIAGVRKFYQPIARGGLTWLPSAATTENAPYVAFYRPG